MQDLDTMTAHVYRPQTLEEWMALSKILASTSFCPRDMKGNPNEVLATLLFGTEAGLTPLQALQNISTGRGKPNIGGDAALALAYRHPQVEDIQEWVDGQEENRTGHCKILFTKASRRPALERTFTLAKAKKAGLIARAEKAQAAMKRKGYDDSPPWLAYQDRMLKMRARGFALRDGVPDALKGLILREEAQDYPTDQARDVERKAERSPSPPPQTSHDPAPSPQAEAQAPSPDPSPDTPPDNPPDNKPRPKDPEAPISEKQRRMVWALLKKFNKDPEELKKVFFVEHINDIKMGSMDRVVAWLEDPEKGKLPIDKPHGDPAPDDPSPEPAAQAQPENGNGSKTEVITADKAKWLEDMISEFGKFDEFKKAFRREPKEITVGQFPAAERMINRWADEQAGGQG